MPAKKGGATRKTGRAAPRPERRGRKDPDVLTPKEQRFVEEYQLDWMQTPAAIRAGYSAKAAKKTAHLLMRRPRIAKAIEALRAKVAEKAELDAKWVLDRLRENVERAMEATPVLDHDGKPTGEYQYKGAIANKGLELIGKHLGMYVEKHEHSGPNGGPIVYADLTDEQLDQRLARLLPHGGA